MARQIDYLARFVPGSSRVDAARLRAPERLQQHEAEPPRAAVPRLLHQGSHTRVKNFRLAEPEYGQRATNQT